jgi:hypothetical protein
MFLLLSLVLSAGCISTYLNDETIGADGKVTKEVTFYRGGFVYPKTEAEKAKYAKLVTHKKLKMSCGVYLVQKSA